MSSVFVFWCSLGFLFYTYIGYPLLMMSWARLRKEQPCDTGRERPSVTVVIAAHNEEKRVLKRLENLFAQDYPEELLDVVVVSDGSTDGTVAVLRELNHPRVTVIELKENRGKAVALNRGVAEAKGQIVVFTDVRQRFAPDVIERLTKAFADPHVGGVTGELVLCESEEGGEPKGVGLYWRYEKAIREAESRVDSTVGATGAIYAIRRWLYRELPAGLILDDVLTPLNVTAQGYRLRMVREALAYDWISSSVNEEFRRKVRTLAGNVQLIQLAPWVMNPFRNRLFFQWFSHKVCRLLAPYALLGLFLSSWLAGGGGYLAFGILQAVGYGIAVYGLYGMTQGREVGKAGVPASFLMLNAAAVVGLLAVLAGHTGRLWKKH